MQTDIRLPIGLFFAVIGIVIALFGFATRGSAIYAHSLNININIYSGICLLIFGVLMLAMALMKKKTDVKKT